MNFTEHVKTRNEQFGTVIFETLSEKIFITNETGGKILQLIEQGKEFPQIVDELSKVYEDNPEIEKDITDFINCLKENNFIARK
tara:strand:- start:164 stop:415 length:252 start_codon:yes stop_codon:yes gene_type:complete